ncbi:DUF3500 domain-containing protein [Aestuariivivens sediminis]|uniref:DUF3500 domain-containing protein n=1 Tax=Aestuariivivens sediminis TaxID=2913557 RepID=UPI001F5AD308|nr:DUF3500 domain-containing protein [Aestuariivivens sediminis]
MMNRLTFLVGVPVLALIMAFSVRVNNPTIAFLEALDENQLREVMLSFSDQSRETWHFLPSEMWPREGISLNQLREGQKELFFKMLQSFLGEVGYHKTQRIMDLERVLAELENNPTFRDAGAYYVAVYGNPRTDKLWAWSFEGHHVSLNFTISEGSVSVAPRFFGANPARITAGPRTGERTLDREEDLAYAFMAALSDEQRHQAVFMETAFADITTAKVAEVKPLDPVGIEAKTLNDTQQRLLKDIIQEYLATLPEGLAEQRGHKIFREEFPDIRFGWAGSLTRGVGHYYRVQGKTFLIEFDNTQNNANHIHLVWRDFDGDFGRDLIKEHYKNSNHHKHE